MIQRLSLLALCLLFAAPGARAGDILNAVRETGEVVLAVRPDVPPFSERAEDGSVQGYSVDICRASVDALALHLGRELTVRYHEVNAENRFHALRSGKAHLLCEATTVTLGRALEERVTFSLLTFVTGGGFVYNTARGAEVASGATDRVGAVAGTTASEALLAAFRNSVGAEKLDARTPQVTLRDYDAALAALEGGEIDFLLGDRLILYRLLKANAELSGDFALAPAQLSYEPYAIAMQSGDPELRYIVDRTLADLYRTGRIGSIVADHFSLTELPPRLATMFELMAIPD